MQKIVNGSFSTTIFLFNSMKQYLRTEIVKNLKELLSKLDADISKELMLRKAITTDRNKVDSILKDTSSYSSINSSFTKPSREPLKQATSLNPLKASKNTSINNKTVNLGSISELSELKQAKTIKGGRDPVKDPSPPMKKTLTKAPVKTKADNRTTDGSSSFLGDESFYS